MSNSILAYPDIKDLLDRALDTESGLKFSVPTAAAAHRLLSRCNHYRVLDRRQNKILYSDPGHLMHGRSVYDKLLIRRGAVPTEIRVEILKPLTVEMEML
jgi:hypothetical protein